MSEVQTAPAKPSKEELDQYPAWKHRRFKVEPKTQHSYTSKATGQTYYKAQPHTTDSEAEVNRLRNCGMLTITENPAWSRFLNAGRVEAARQNMQNRIKGLLVGKGVPEAKAEEVVAAAAPSLEDELNAIAKDLLPDQIGDAESILLQGLEDLDISALTDEDQPPTADAETSNPPPTGGKGSGKKKTT